MSCEKYDWKAYALGELDANGRRQAEAHAATCPACREELGSVRLTLDTLSTLHDEEVPRRIAFVSDQVFEPRWWRAFLRPSFAAGCVVAAAILVHAFVRPSFSNDQALQANVNAAVTAAVAQLEQRHSQQIEQLLADYEVVLKQNQIMYVKDTGMVRQ